MIDNFLKDLNKKPNYQINARLTLDYKDYLLFNKIRETRNFVIGKKLIFLKRNSKLLKQIILEMKREWKTKIIKNNLKWKNITLFFGGNRLKENARWQLLFFNKKKNRFIVISDSIHLKKLTIWVFI